MSSRTVSSSLPTTAVTPAKLLPTAIVAAVVAAVANVVVYFIAQAAGVGLVITQPPDNALMPLPVPAVIIFSVVPAFLAAGLLWLLARFTQQPLRVFQIIAAIVLALSFVPDLVMPVGPAVKLTLTVMHLIAAGVIVYFFSTRARA